MMRVVSAEQRDLPLLFALNKQLIMEYEDLSSIDCEQVFSWVQRNLEAKLPCFYRVLRKETLVGFFCLSDGELDSLFVLPEYRGTGIGTWVIRHCQAQSSSLMLYVFRRNTRALDLYQKLGFQITREVGKTRYIMEWKNQDR